ncbi:MAG: 3-hydroxyacyl-[acyl-carrier-protein] dehydratase FabZ [Candidatus Hydrothermota bacterium]|nr:MAG: 3-hydroxyacyl-[acyl-carrier-protein] dehydratase FabZ [Candidatus Hydrothermae bacterium]
MHDVLNIMPHRYPFLLVDRIVSLSEDYVVGIKNVTYNEPFFQGHFPDDPIMPGVLIVEAMAQVGGFLLLHRVEDKENKLLYFSGIDDVRFKRPVRPGDRIRFELRLIRFGGRIAKMAGVAKVGGEIAVSATLTAAIVEKPKAKLS